MFVFPQVHSKVLVFLPLFGYGLAWASIMGVPFLLIVNQIPKERYGVYMGIINMMIVIPMLIYGSIFGKIFNTMLHKEPINAIYFGGILMLIASILTLLLFAKKKN
jgi:maltose/moltooligosaccharide transporter